MIRRAFPSLREDEYQLLKVFQRYGADGRAIPLRSLAIHSNLGPDAKRFMSALNSLCESKLVSAAGDDPLATSSRAFRLTEHWSADFANLEKATRH